jgi:hypothetical protein
MQKQTQNQVQPFTSIAGKSLMSQPIEPLGFTVADILPHGLFILSGSAKAGKSWLALDLCNCVATGDTIWNYSTTHGEALYLALEDTPKRMRERLSKIAPDYDFNAPTDIHFAHRSFKLGEGLAEQITAFLADHPKTQLIVVDTLQYIRNTGNTVSTYATDYRDMDALRDIIKGRKLTMILVTHNHKADTDDPLNKVYGSAGLTGAVDGIFVLEKRRRTGDTARLTIANRDTEGHEFTLRFNRSNCRWEFISEDCGEPDADEKLFDVLNFLLDETPVWSGTATELNAMLTVLDPSFRFSPIGLSKTLKARQNILREQHGIECVFTRCKTARLIELSRDVIVAESEVASNVSGSPKHFSRLLG